MMRLRIRLAATLLLLAAHCPALYREERFASILTPIRASLFIVLLASLFPAYTVAHDLDTGKTMQSASPETHCAIRTIYVKAEGAETLAAARARNLLVSDKCYTITALEDQADAILSISSEKQGASSIFTHIPFTGQKIYTSATLFDRRTGEVLWTTDRSDIWFGSPAKAGERIVQRLKKDRQCD
jgi:hypothetical protein